LWPAVGKLLKDYPEVKVELSIDSHLTDIIAHRFDAGIRLGEQIAKDMIAVRIGQSCVWRSSARRHILRSTSAPKHRMI
jgi:DNA-binding transcriptional LysR family regulator